MIRPASLYLSALLWDWAHAESYTSFNFKRDGPASEHMVSEGVERPYKVISETFFSQRFALLPGQMLFTDPPRTRLPMPEGQYAIVGIHGDIVKNAHNDKKIAAPVSEVYNHHWTVIEYSHRNRLCPDGPAYVFGIPAESRGSKTRFPKGHGYVPPRKARWGAHVNLLRLDSGDDLVGDDRWAAAARCAECYFDASGTKGSKCTPERNGTMRCCGNACYHGTCSCPTKPGTPMVARSYYLRYTLSYTRDVAAITSLDVGILATPNCAHSYAVHENNDNPYSLSSASFEMPTDMEIMLGVGHLHTGGINVSLFHNDDFVCASYATYGTQEDVPGNEKGHLVAMSECINAGISGGSGVAVRKGVRLRLDAWHWVGRADPRIAPTPGGTHLDVMAHMYTAYKLLRS